MLIGHLSNLTSHLSRKAGYLICRALHDEKNENIQKKSKTYWKLKPVIEERAFLGEELLILFKCNYL